MSYARVWIRKLEPSRKTNVDVFTYSVSLNKREGKECSPNVFDCSFIFIKKKKPVTLIP